MCARRQSTYNPYAVPSWCSGTTSATNGQRAQANKEYATPNIPYQENKAVIETLHSTPPFSRLFQTVSNAHSMLLTVLTATTDCLKRCRMKSTAHKLVLVMSSTNYSGREAPSHKMGSVCFQSSFLGGGLPILHFGR